MSKIRKLYYFDKKIVKEMVSFLTNDLENTYLNNIVFNPFIFLHYFLPLRFKYLPESYIFKDNKITRGLITVAPAECHNKKIEIKKIFFEENSYSVAEDLVHYVVSRYKAMGATSVIIRVDDFLPELLTMLVSKCGFTQISYEKLWRINDYTFENNDTLNFRPFRKTDLNAVANLYNESLLPHFRPLLSKEPADYRESIFKGLAYYSEYRYILEDKESKNVAGLVSIKTSDNSNFIIDVVQSGWVDVDISSIISFAVKQIRKRKKEFSLFIKSKRYNNFGEKYEKYFMEKCFECVQNQIVLTNSSAKILHTAEKTGKYTILTDFCPTGVNICS